MTDPTQDILTDLEHPQIKYSTAWQRFFAVIIDGLILSPFVLIDSFNKTTWKSYPILAISFLITLAYKPFLESRYGATLGKMAIKLTIVNASYQKADIKNVILRNTFEIVNRLLLAVVAVITFTNPAFEDVDSLAGYSKLSNSEAGALAVTISLSVLFLIDAIFLIADRRRQSLHDKIGQTFVIQK